METAVETKKHQRFTKRRERKTTADGSGDEMDDSPSRPSKDKRSKPRRKKHNMICEEDIIDGFAIISFKTFEDLENAVKNSINLNDKTDLCNSQNKERDKEKNNRVKKKREKKSQKISPHSPTLPGKPYEDPLGSPRSDQTVVLDHNLNGPNHTSQDVLSDASSHSSSGRGYLCDSESGDDRASDASSDIFTTVNTVNRSRECIVTNNTSTPTVCSSPCPAGITTTPSLSSPATTATTTAAPTTTSALTVSATTTCGTITTSCSPVSVAAPITTPSVISSGPRTAPPTAPPAKRPTLPPSSPTSSHPALTASRPPSRTAQIHNRENRKSSSPLPPPRPLANKREEHREKDPQLPSSLPFSKSRTSANSSGHHRYSPQISPSASIPPYPLHSTPNHTPTFPPHHPQLPPHPPSAHTPGHPPHSMFAPPLPPGPAGASLTSGSLSGASAVSLSSHSPSDSMSYANQEILREELNRRFLATQDRPVPSIGGAHPFIRSDVHQHQHQHMHQHQHTHQHMYPIHIPGSLGPPPAPLLYEKVPKLDSPFYRPQIPGLQTYPTGMSPLMPPAGPGPLNSGLNSGIPGAFQPKRVSSSLHPAQMMLASLRDRDKANPTPGGGLPAQKKSGKWCAVHVRIAWEIYQHQQRQSDTQKGQSEGKNVEPLRPPSHLLLGSSVHKGPELGPTPGLMGPGGPRSILESSGHAGLIGQNAIRAPFSSGRDVPTVHGMTPPPHEWGNRLHRTPPSFPTPWPKQMEEREKEEREREKERDLEREREKEREKRDYIGLDRRREDDRERERRNSERLQINCLTDRSRDRDKIFPTESVRPARSRSRSRSPLQNGRVGSAKSDSSFERRFDDRGGLKIKEERRDEDMLHGERDKIRNEYMLGPSMPNPNNPLAMFDRSRLFMGASPFLAADRVPSHPLWQYEKNAMEFNHRMQLQQEMERERLIHRIPSHATSLQEMEQERMRKEELLFQDERFRRDYLSSMPMYERERLAAYEQQSRFSGLRTAELGATSHFNRTLSPMVNHAGARTTLSPMVNHIGARTMSPMVNHVGVKGSSPACAPPPLIPSSSAASHSHSNSPAVAKAKGHHGEPGLGDKRDTYSNSTDPESHSR
ncbi:autism susceptibility gene 2 protein-like isoform X3 [Mizuhopecten yessoensis]|uniref:autism susceptibility gene 2 protein-like isoform X3 n=1 Tax=Mizuhopecten yessoensis TaxID=6573 RepID=UPI000B457FA1|nr:autism susceptibility gene 2 protein-like isoform X3 [Mizuhopecten yessoensis]